jgi:hypothetical protein
VAVVIVESPSDRLVGRTSTLSGTHDGHPDRDSRRRAASRFGLRPTRLAATKDLHHFLGHQHFVWAKDGEVIFQVNGMGPTATTPVQVKK